MDDLGVAVEIEIDDSDAPADRGGARGDAGRQIEGQQAGGRGDVDEGVASPVEEQLIGLVEVEGLDEDGDLIPHVEDVGDGDVEAAVEVDVAHRTGSRRGALRRQPARRRDVLESAVAAVLEQAFRLQVAEHQEVRIAVVVEVAVADAGRILVAGRDFGARRDVDEAHLSGVADLIGEEAVVPARAVGHVEILVAVTVVVQNRYPGAPWLLIGVATSSSKP